MNATHKLARFIARGGGTQEERDFFFSLCKTLPELKATYLAIQAAWEDEAADALEEATPDLVHAFLTGNLDSDQSGQLCSRALAQDGMVLEQLSEVLAVYPHLWANADRSLHFLPIENQLRLGLIRLALAALLRAPIARSHDQAPALFADPVRIQVTGGPLTHPNEVPAPASLKIGLDCPLKIALESLPQVETLIGLPARLFLGEGEDVLGTGRIDNAGYAIIEPENLLRAICALFPDRTLNLALFTGAKKPRPLCVVVG